MKSSLPRARLLTLQTTSKLLVSRAFSGSGSKRVMAPLTINSKVRMNSGYEIPILGYGVYQTPASECERVTAHAFKVGYRHVDSAIGYRNEAPCAEAIHKSGISREHVFFTSKIHPAKLGYENTKLQVDNTLKETGLKYVDLMLLHAPYGGPEARKGAWDALVEAQEAGKIRSLGISNYGVHHLEELENHIKKLEKERGEGKAGVISVGQWELHPWLSRQDIVEWCEKRGVILEAYCPIVRGSRNEDKLLKPLTEKYGKTAPQILLRWSLQRGFVPLPKSVTPSRIEENSQLYDFELTKEDMHSLETEEYSPCAWDPTVSTLEQ